MPSQRRTRAMGHSPGGPKALDINAPTRQLRKGKASAAAEDAPAPAAKATRARSGPKRKNEDLVAEEPPAKRFRLNQADGKSERVASGSQSLLPLADSESKELQEFASSSQEEDPALKPQQDTEPRVNAQQPTPPLDSPVNASIEQPTTNEPQANTQEDTSVANAQSGLDQKKKNERRVSDMIRRYKIVRQEAEDDEKALSECDDDEWEKRYSAVMEESRNPKPFIPTSKSECEKWVPGSTAMFVVREPKQKDSVAGKKSGPCMPPLTFTTASRLPALGARPITNIDTIVAISASLDWYEKNPTIAAPSAAEMNAMLDNFARAQQAQQVQAANPVFAQNPQNRASDSALTTIAQVTGEDLAEAPHSSEFDDGYPNADDHEEPGMDQNEDYSADVETNRVEAAVPQTPQQHQAQHGPRTWSSALSASAIGNVILTPLNNWFARRDRQRRNVAATEPRPVKAKPDLSRPAQSHQKSRSQDTPDQSSKILSAKSKFLPNLEDTLAPDSPTPAPPQPRRGRPDSHLPVHLRGVLFEDLPPEWQAVSRHLKKPQQVQVEDEEDEVVDMEYLLATAKRTRKERDRKDLQEQAELIAQKQRDLESDDESSADHIHRKGKKRVTFSPQKTYSAKLGHSTFGMPANIGETSSDEDSEPPRPRTHFGRNSRPLKSCLKRTYQQPTCEDYSEMDNGEDGYEPRPAKKARLDERAPSQSSDISDSNEDMPSRGEGCESFLYEDNPLRARPLNRFISKPPSELRRAETAQMEFERLNPMNRSQGIQAGIGRTPGLRGNDSNNPNLFASGSRNPCQDWLSLFQGPARRHTGSTSRHDLPLWLYEGGIRRHRLPPSSTPRDKNGRLIRTTPALQKAKEARLNQQRDEAFKEKIEAEETRSNQQRDETLKENKEAEETRLSQRRDETLKENKEAEETPLSQQSDDTMKHKPDESRDLQVARTSSLIQEKRSFHNMVLDEEVLKAIALLDDDEILAESFGNYPDHTEATISEEASKAIEYPALLGGVAEDREAGRVEEAKKAIEYPTWFDRAARA